MSGHTISLELTVQEILLLDGQCRPEIQEAVERAKLASTLSGGLSESEAEMVAKILDVARKNGRLTFVPTTISYCPCCKRNDGYWPVKRATKYKTRGEPDYDKPKLFPAWELDRGFVVVKNHVRAGVCETCRPRVFPVLAERLAGMRAELPKEITGIEPRYKRVAHMACAACGWQGLETEVGLLPAMFGGTYRGQCPSCKGKVHIRTVDGFSVVEQEAA